MKRHNLIPLHRKSKTEREMLFSLILKDHHKVKRLFSKLEKTSDRAYLTRNELFDQLREELNKHAQAEEKSIYPILTDEKTTRELGLECIEEHTLVRILLKKMASVSSASEKWMATCSVLKEIVEQHVEREETKVFAALKKHASREERNALSVEFSDAKHGVIETIREVVGLAHY